MVDKVFNDIRVYTDVQSLEQLRNSKNPTMAKKEVAKQFESMLLQMMLRSMRDANKAFASDLCGSNQMDMYQDLYDKQLTLSLTNSGIGFSKIVEQNLERMQPTIPSKQPEVATIPNAIPLVKIRQNNDAPQPLAVQQAPLQAADQIQPMTAAVQTSAPPEKPSFNTPEDFVKHLWPIAKTAAGIIGASPQVLLAQAALETNWGKNVIQHTDNSSTHNLFNIKADNTWDKRSATVDTLEQKNGVLVKEKSAFRSYDSYVASFKDYVNFLKQNGRYTEALKKVSNPGEYVHALQQAGYATDTNYADKVLKIFSSKTFKELVAKVE